MLNRCASTFTPPTMRNAETNTVYRDKARAYQSALREIGYKVIEKRVKWFQDEAGNRYGKANADLDMAVDAVLLQSENLDRVLLVTGDGDFVQVVRAPEQGLPGGNPGLRQCVRGTAPRIGHVRFRLSGTGPAADPGR